MELLEGLFKKYWKTKRQQQRRLPSTVYLSERAEYLKFIVGSLLGCGENLQIIAARTYTGFANGHLFLPEWISEFPEARLNEEAYLYLAIKACGVEKAVGAEVVSLSAPLDGRFIVLSKMAKVNRLIDEWLPNFAIFEKEFLSSLKGQLEGQIPSSQKEIYAYWFKLIASRQETKDHVDLTRWRKNARPPRFLHLTVPGLSRPFLLQDHARLMSQSQDTSARGSEKEKPTLDPVQDVSLEDEKKRHNPVAHSFEKIETLDDYQGGFRQTSGDDDMDSHADALEELDMRALTLDGESSQSLYKSDGLLVRLSQNIPSTEVGAEEFYYPEWSQSCGEYLPNHCHIHLNRYPVSAGPAGVFKDELSHRDYGNILQWRKKVMAIVNEPVWRMRQREGAEVDYDAVIRHLINVRSGHLDDDRLFAQKTKTMRDLGVLILFDQSLSTDSWLGDHRILDIMRDSIGLCGLLFEDIIHQVMVAGTWSASRHNCDFHIYKGFDHSWLEYYQQAKCIEPVGYTRLGPAIRHSTALLKSLQARKKILLLLTDGKPTDLDHYEGAHGLNDVRKACAEAETTGILPYALTLDKGEKSYFSTMFRRFSVLPSPEQFQNEIIKILLLSLK